MADESCVPLGIIGDVCVIYHIIHQRNLVKTNIRSLR